MIIINLKDGLGNQMFQYSLGYALSKKNNTKLSLDLRVLNEFKKNPPNNYIVRDYDLDIFNISYEKPQYQNILKIFEVLSKYKYRFHISKILDKLNMNTFLERSRMYENRILESKNKNLYLDGYWQSEKYFSNYRNEILDIFNFKTIEHEQHNIDIIKKINSLNSVCVNVRRTDHIKENASALDTINLAYYTKAIEHLKKLEKSELHFFIFSDDIDWCKKNLSFIPNINFVEHALYAGKKFYNYLYLMTQFKKFIIPNSTFAWWGAWLSKHENKTVIVPAKWHKTDFYEAADIIPDNWIVINN